MNESGTVFGNATKRDVQCLPLFVPPLSEQRHIAHILGTLDVKIELKPPNELDARGDGSGGLQGLVREFWYGTGEDGGSAGCFGC